MPLEMSSSVIQGASVWEVEKRDLEEYFLGSVVFFFIYSYLGGLAASFN